MNKKVVTRVAPSPTSPYGLHVGNIRTLLFCYLFAKKDNGTFYLRIEDTDQGRFCPGAEDLIRKTLTWIGIEPDFAPWTEHPFGSMSQSERDYSKYVKILLDSGMAYYAFDTPEELDAMRAKSPNFAYNHQIRIGLKNSLTMPADEVTKLLADNTPHVIRFKVPENKSITFTDIIRGEVTFNTNQMDDRVLIKSNGIGSYHLCNVCDDHDMGTTHVIRGEEWLSSTPLHIMIYEALGWEVPQFAHLPLVLNPPGMKGKLSKRNAVKLGIPIFPFGGDGEDENGKFTLNGFVEDGYEPAALINFLLLLGWTPPHLKDGNEIMSLQEAIQAFDLSDVHKNGAKYDIEKLKFFNGWYIQNTVSNDELLGCVNFGDTHFTHEDKLAIIDMAKKRSHFRKDLQTVVDIFTKHVVLTDKQLATVTDQYKQTLIAFMNEIQGTDHWNADYIKQSIYNACEQTGVKMGKIMPIIRTVLAGGITGPDMVSFMTIMPKADILKRMLSIVKPVTA